MTFAVTGLFTGMRYMLCVDLDGAGAMPLGPTGLEIFGHEPSAQLHLSDPLQLLPGPPGRELPKRWAVASRSAGRAEQDLCLCGHHLGHAGHLGPKARAELRDLRPLAFLPKQMEEQLRWTTAMVRATRGSESMWLVLATSSLLRSKPPRHLALNGFIMNLYIQYIHSYII